MVRYLTRRYLGEYANAPEMTYERVVAVAEKQVPVKITDFSGKVLTEIQLSTVFSILCTTNFTLFVRKTGCTLFTMYG